MGCCTSDNKLTMVACGRGASCAGECSAVQAYLCPSRNCTGNPEDCSLEPRLELEEEGEENLERCPTCSAGHLKWCTPDCPVSTSHECCYHPKCYNQMKEECCWRDYLTGGCLYLLGCDVLIQNGRKLFRTLKFVDSLPKLTLGSIWETLRWPPIPSRNITSVTEFSQQGKKVFFPVFFFFRANKG